MYIQYAHIKNAPSASHLTRSESLLPNPNGGFGLIFDPDHEKIAFFAMHTGFFPAMLKMLLSIDVLVAQFIIIMLCRFA